LLGVVFKNERSTSTRTELYIVITPRVVRHRRDRPADAPPETEVAPLPPAPQALEPMPVQ